MTPHSSARYAFLVLLLLASLAPAEEPIWCRAGYVGKLYLDEKATVAPVGKDQQSFYAFLKAQSIGDKEGVLEMLKAGTVFVAQTRGPRIRVLDCDRSEKQTKIRVLDGRHASKAGWTFYKWIE